MDEDIEDVLFPDNGILEKDSSGTYTAVVVDDELDPIKCTFNNDGCVEIDTEGYTYMSLSIENLYLMIELIKAAEDLYENESDDDEG